MILIADSGSTKTDWALTGQSVQIHTQGINPFHQSRETVEGILCDELLPQLAQAGMKDSVSSVCFYGSGVRPELESVMGDVLHKVFPKAETVEAHSDMLGAARSVCFHNEGIASILGTGANSCLYDGERIVKNTLALGYILGDEGSGAVLGKRFLHDVYSGILSEEIKFCFERETGLSMPELINRVYRQPLANRFLASLSKFIHNHLDKPELSDLVRQNFVDFIHIHILPYGRKDLPLSFVGSIAWHFRQQLAEAADAEGLSLGSILKSPIDGLVRYHQQ